ncbi:unnamed protein product [Prorocentrum cordatum]|uniref:Uncharacterized protein n=1 Tax=Prorocentrum cordatum TaxID=2364126 RepID=A0ABN9SL49_9DINO|nr:unnamed protein product [Polarella glacialis]
MHNGWNPPHAEKSTGLASLGERKGQIAKGEGRTPPAPSQSRDGLAHFTGRSLCKFTAWGTDIRRPQEAAGMDMCGPRGAQNDGPHPLPKMSTSTASWDSEAGQGLPNPWLLKSTSGKLSSSFREEAPSRRPPGETRRTRRTRSRAAKREELRAPEGALGGALGGGPKRRGGRGRPSAPARPPARAAARLEAAGVRGARRGGRRRHRAPRRPPPLPGGHAPKGDGARPAPPGGLLDGVAGWRGASERGGQQGGRRGPGAPEDEREEEGEEEGEGREEEEEERRRTEGGKS